MNRSTRIIGSLAVGAIALGVPAAFASSAFAATNHAVTAETLLINRPDGGGGPNPWAWDTMERTLTIQSLGKVLITSAMASANPELTPFGGQVMYQYDATLQDKGTFKDIPGQLTPNQGGHDAGKVLKPTQVTGTVTGTGDFGVFYSTKKVNSDRDYANLGVPIRQRGDVDPSYTWPELAFPSGTQFVGVNEFNFYYSYTVPAFTVTIHGVKHTVKAQHWVDSAANGDGQLQGDGNITGR
jgi:hypothetical protein